MKISTRIKQAMKEKGMTQADLSKKSGISKSTLSEWLNDKYEPKQNNIYILSESLGVNPTWLMGLEVDKEINRDITVIYNELEQPRQEKVYSYAEEQLERQNKVININKYSKDSTEDDLIEETMEGYLSAGTGEFLAEDIKEPIMIHRSLLPEQHYDMILQVNGDSMEPMFEDHEYVFIRTTEEIRNGQIGVFVIDGESLLKKVYINDDHLRLVSLNKKYDDLIFDSVNDIHLIGTVVM